MGCCYYLHVVGEEVPDHEEWMTSIKKWPIPTGAYEMKLEGKVALVTGTSPNIIS